MFAHELSDVLVLPICACFWPLDRDRSIMCKDKGRDGDETIPNILKDADMGAHERKSSFALGCVVSCPLRTPCTRHACPQQNFVMLVGVDLIDHPGESLLSGDIMAKGDANNKASVGPLCGLADLACFVTAPFKDDAPALSIPLGTRASRARTRASRARTTGNGLFQRASFFAFGKSVVKHCAYVPRCARDGPAGVNFAMFLIGKVIVEDLVSVAVDCCSARNQTVRWSVAT